MPGDVPPWVMMPWIRVSGARYCRSALIALKVCRTPSGTLMPCSGASAACAALPTNSNSSPHDASEVVVETESSVPGCTMIAASTAVRRHRRATTGFCLLIHRRLIPPPGSRERRRCRVNQRQLPPSASTTQAARRRSGCGRTRDPLRAEHPSQPGSQRMAAHTGRVPQRGTPSAYGRCRVSTTSPPCSSSRLRADRRPGLPVSKLRGAMDCQAGFPQPHRPVVHSRTGSHLQVFRVGHPPSPKPAARRPFRRAPNQSSAERTRQVFRQVHHLQPTPFAPGGIRKSALALLAGGHEGAGAGLQGLRQAPRREARRLPGPPPPGCRRRRSRARSRDCPPFPPVRGPGWPRRGGGRIVDTAVAAQVTRVMIGHVPALRGRQLNGPACQEPMSSSVPCSNSTFGVRRAIPDRCVSTCGSTMGRS